MTRVFVGTADAASTAATTMQTEFTSFQIENSKWSKGVDSKLGNLQSSLNDQMSLLSEQKANKADVVDLKNRVEVVSKTGSQIKIDMEHLQHLVEQFVAGDSARARARGNGRAREREREGRRERERERDIPFFYPWSSSLLNCSANCH